MSIVRLSLRSVRAIRHAVDTLEGRVAMAAGLVGVAAWTIYAQLGLVLSHYDAKAHLVVARRVIDNLTPGWKQIGAVWLPLPHLLLLLPVQIDALYRTGLAGSLISLMCLVVTAGTFARLVSRLTGSTPGAIVAASLFTFNPSLLYLHTTPMTEPLLFAATAVSVLWTVEWIDTNQDHVPRGLGYLLFATTWIRYEAWAVVATTGVLALAVWLRQGLPVTRVARRVASLAAWPAAAAGAFLVLSRLTVGRWFVSDGFFVPDDRYAGSLTSSLLAIGRGTRDLSGTMVVTVGLLGALALLWHGAVSQPSPQPSPKRPQPGRPLSASPAPPLPQGTVARLGVEGRTWSTGSPWVLLALGGAVLLPLVAFYQGHPFRIRYMTPLVTFAALCGGITIGTLPRRAQWWAGGLVILVALLEAPPLSPRAPMVVEAQLDRPAGLARQAVSACLARDYRGEKVLASMGSLAHYMHELSALGFSIRDFVHEGTGVIWEVALESGPARHVGWMLVEEVAEGGDVLATRLRRDPAFATGMTRTCEAGGVALYRREPRSAQR